MYFSLEMGPRSSFGGRERRRQLGNSVVYPLFCSPSKLELFLFDSRLSGSTLDKGSKAEGTLDPSFTDSSLFLLPSTDLLLPSLFVVPQPSLSRSDRERDSSLR